MCAKNREIKQELASLDAIALERQIVKLKKELCGKRVDASTVQIKDFSVFSCLRKKIAQAKTFLNEKRIQGGGKK